MNKSFTHWEQSVAALKGVGPKLLEKLEKLSIYTVGDLLLHCPYRYEDRTQVTPIAHVREAHWVVVQGEIIHVNVIKARKKRCIIQIADQSSSLQLVFFHFHPTQQKQWQVGTLLRCYGQAKATQSGLSLSHPEYEVISPHVPQSLPTHLTPVYPTVAGLSQAWLRKTILAVLECYGQCVEQQEDPFATAFAFVKPMASWINALNTIHRPCAQEDCEKLLARIHPAYYRLIIEELFAHQMSLKKVRTLNQVQQAMKLSLPATQQQAFLAQLPFSLTTAQAKVWQEIREDLACTKPMMRLVQGDVGCGKTIVSVMAALAAVTVKTQVAVMVPTEILAEQHFNYFSSLFAPQGYRCELLTSQLKAKAKRSLNENLQLGLTDIVIGTHALFQENIQFKRLGLVIIDEQHRFGVHQRLALQSKGLNSLVPIAAHQLIMTATPIPRTLAMSHYAHLDISVIDSLPPNRQPITTIVLPHTRRDEIIARITRVCEQGQQVYWVCTLITESEVLECQAVEKTAELLQHALPGQRIGLVHGKVGASQKESTMQAFYAKEIDVLVATTVIEVGVNVPNATLMIIENPERLGLAQLHQLRGRVGRGAKASFCVLLYQGPLSEMAQARLRIMRESQDGFVIAQADLELRGPGEVLGIKQTGAMQFKVADFHRDGEFIQTLAAKSEHAATLGEQQVEKIIQRWCSGRHYAQA